MYARYNYIRLFLILSLPFLLLFTTAQFRFAANSDIFDGSFLRLYPFFIFEDSDLFTTDIFKIDVFSTTPFGFTALQYIWAQFFSLEVLHRALPIVLWLTCVPFVYIAAKQIRGELNGIITVIIYLCSSMFMHRFAGAVPHSFAFVFAWWTIAAFCTGNILSLSLCAILSALFYPVLTPISGLCLAASMLLPHFTASAAITKALINKAVFKKFLFLVGVAGVCALCVIPVVTSTYAEKGSGNVDVLKDLQQFPELQGYVTVNPIAVALMEMYGGQSFARLGLEGTLCFLTLFFLLLFASAFCQKTSDTRLRNLIIYIAISLLLCLVSLYLDPLNAYRYITYTIPVGTTLYLPVAFRRITRFFSAKHRPVLFQLMLLLYLFCVTAPHPEASGYRNALDAESKEVLQFIGTLPKDSLIAGWPGTLDGGRYVGSVISYVPYFAKRQIFISTDFRISNQKDYLIAMRDRMRAVIDAYFAKDKADLYRLRDQYDVDYLIVNENDFLEKDSTLYPEPFSDHIRALLAGANFATLAIAKERSIYHKNGVYIIDLQNL